ncbi:MAG TPA: TIGR03557 family F420-dependent LLM class oxidoreductase [Candidatus Limnocylindria bacterium]|nr:TIGR03557 family F420-dependent LLM class oxidoreductase [Candidatus Limnocylindria bacterium]
MLTIGYKASAEQFAPPRLLDYAVLAEELGFDSVAVSDHFHPWRDTGGHAPFALSWLGALTQRTSRVRMGTSVAAPAYRYHPALIAQAFATLDQLAPGRLFLGLGSGESMNETPVTVAEWPSPGERLRRLAESVKVIRMLWTDDYVTFEGRHVRVKDAKIFDKPVRPIPILTAASGPKAAEQAGRDADGLIVTSGKGQELYRDVLLPNFTKGARDAGKDPASAELMIEMKVSFDTDRERAMRDTQEWAALALPGEDKAGVEDPREMERRAESAKDRAHTRFIVSTDPEEHVEKMRPYLGLGFRHLVFHFPGEDQEHAMRLYAKEVVPRLRRLS